MLSQRLLLLLLLLLLCEDIYIYISGINEFIDFHVKKNYNNNSISK
jgi:hypothetical protein